MIKTCINRMRSNIRKDHYTGVFSHPVISFRVNLEHLIINRRRYFSISKNYMYSKYTGVSFRLYKPSSLIVYAGRVGNIHYMEYQKVHNDSDVTFRISKSSSLIIYRRQDKLIMQYHRTNSDNWLITKGFKISSSRGLLYISKEAKKTSMDNNSHKIFDYNRGFMITKGAAIDRMVLYTSGHYERNLLYNHGFKITRQNPLQNKYSVRFGRLCSSLSNRLSSSINTFRIINPC